MSWRTLVLSVVLVAALAAAGLFGLGLSQVAGLWSDPPPPAPEGWMTPRYVARTWHLPPEEVAAALGVAMDGSGRRVTLQALAAERGLPLAGVVVPLQALIAARSP